MNTELLGMPTPGDVHVGVPWDVGLDTEQEEGWMVGVHRNTPPDSVPTVPMALDRTLDHDANSSDMWKPGRRFDDDARYPTSAWPRGEFSVYPRVPDWQKRKDELDGAFDRGRAAGYDAGFSQGYARGFEAGHTASFDEANEWAAS